MFKLFRKLAAFMLLAAPCFAQGVPRHNVALVKASGTVAANVVPFAKVNVCVTGTFCDTLQTVYSDIGLTQVLHQPITADASGNYSYYYAPGCVDEEFSSPGQGTVTTNNVCAFVPGGASFPSTFPKIVVNTSTTASRNAVLADFVGSTGIWTGTSCNVGTNALLVNGLCGAAGGGGSPGGAQFNAQYNNSGTLGGSAALFDAVGNFKSLSLDGLKMAFLNQTTATSNNGIQNSLQTIGSFVVAGQDYASVEGIYGSGLCPNYRLAIGCPAPFAGGTEMTDYRLGILGTYTYNTFLAPGGGTWKFNRWIQNQLPVNSLSVTNFPYLQDFEMSGSGLNGFNVNTGPDSFGSYQYNYELMTRGIVSAVNYQVNAYALGDDHLFQFTVNNQRGTTAGADEGFNIFRNQVNQNLTPMVMTANSTYAAGATLIQGTLISSVPFVGDGTYLMNFSQGSAIFNITADMQPNPGAGLAGQFTYSTTLTPDNVGNVAAAVNTPVKRYGGTTNETVTITGLTSALSTSQSVCVADGNQIESATLVSAGTFAGGTATGAVIAMRLNHQPGFYVAQGSHACNVVEMRANEESGSFAARQLIHTIGAINAHQMLYSRIVAGGWNDAFSGYASTEVVALAGATLTRNGSGTSVAITDPFFHLSGIGVIVSGCSDSSFNGTWTATADTGTTLTWSNTGTTTTTTCTADTEVLSRRNTFSVRSAQEFPAAEIVNTNDPTTAALNYNISVEPNTNFHVVSGNQLENHPYSDVIMGVDRNLFTFHSQNSQSIADIMHGEQYDGAIPSAWGWMTLKLTDNPVGYIGHGGSKPVGAVLFNMNGSITPFSSLFFGLPVPEGSVFNFNGCAFACSDTRSQFTFYSFQTNGGSYQEMIHQDTGEVDITTSNSTSLFVEKKLPGGWAMQVNQPGPLANIFSMHGGITEDDVFGTGGVTSHMIQTPTGWSIDVPITVPSCIGCGSPITGSVTTTAATTDVVTVTGMTSSGHCAISPTNAAAGTMIQNATPVFVDTFTTNAVTLHHVASASASFNLICTAN